jgi:hypothetical protein
LTPAHVVELALLIESASRGASKYQTISEPFDAAEVETPTALGVNDCIKTANVKIIDRLIVYGLSVTAGIVPDSCGVGASVVLPVSR